MASRLPLVLVLVLLHSSGGLATAQCTAWKALTDGTLQCTSTAGSSPTTDRSETYQLAPVAPAVITPQKACFVSSEGRLLYRSWERDKWRWVVGPQLHGGRVIKLATRTGITNPAPSDTGELMLMLVLSNGKLLVQRTARKGRPWQRVDCGRAVLDIGSEAQRQGVMGAGVFLLFKHNLIAIGTFNHDTMGWQQWALLNASIPMPALAQDPIKTMSADLIDNTIFLTTLSGVVVSMSKTETSDYTWMNHSYTSSVRCGSALVKISQSFFCISKGGILMEWLSPGWERINNFINAKDPSFGRWTQVSHASPAPKVLPSGIPDPNFHILFDKHLPLTVHERSLFMLSTSGQLYERHWDSNQDKWVWFSHPFRENWSLIGGAVNSRTFFLGSSNTAYEYHYSEAHAKWQFIDCELDKVSVK